MPHGPKACSGALFHGKAAPMAAFGGMLAEMHMELAGLHPPDIVPAQGPHGFRTDDQLNRLLLPGLQVHPGKAAELPFGLDRGTEAVPDVELGHGGAPSGAHIGNGDGGRDAFAGRNGGPVQRKAPVFKLCIAQTVAKVIAHLIRRTGKDIKNCKIY